MLRVVWFLPSLLVILLQATALGALLEEECKNITASLGAADTNKKRTVYDDRPQQVYTRKSCASATSNARGHYHSQFLACEFSFHKSATDDRSPFSMATVCGDENELLPTATIREYVTSWPDDCVGDYARCYSIEQDKSIYLNFVCLQGWDLPEGTTHISVNCTADKTIAIAAQETTHNGDPEFEEAKKMVENLELVAYIMVGCMTVMCMVWCVFGYFWIVKPYTDVVHETGTIEANRLVAAEVSPGIEAQIT